MKQVAPLSATLATSSQPPDGKATMSFTNYIQFNSDEFETATGTGLLSTLERDIEIKVIPFNSTNPKAPTHRVFGRSPRGLDIEIGGIWKKSNAENKPYYSLSVKSLKLNANLGRFPGQDDPTLQAIIAWAPQE